MRLENKNLETKLPLSEKPKYNIMILHDIFELIDQSAVPVTVTNPQQLVKPIGANPFRRPRITRAFKPPIVKALNRVKPIIHTPRLKLSGLKFHR